jgi:hypothetical protein
MPPLTLPPSDHRALPFADEAVLPAPLSSLAGPSSAQADAVASAARPPARQFSRRSSARELLDRLGHALHPNGVAYAALGNSLAGSRTSRFGAPLSSMESGPLREPAAAPAAHEPVLLPGALNPAGRHARDAARIAVGQLLSGPGAAAWPLPVLSGTGAADDEEGDGELAAALGSERHLLEQARRLFSVPAGAADAASGRAVQEISALAMSTASTPGQRLAGPCERPLMLLLALSAASGGRRYRALDALRHLRGGIGLDDGAAALAGPPTAAAAHEAAPALDGDAGTAWRDGAGAARTAWDAAALLAGAGGPGYEALLALMPPLPGDPGQRRRREQSLRICLEARAGVAAGQAPARLASAAAVKLWRCPELEGAGLSREEKDAHFNWRNGFRDDGADGELAAAQASLHKFLVRLVRTGEGGPAGRILNAAGRYLGWRKTPFRALLDGTRGAHLDTDAKENEKFDRPFALALQTLDAALGAALPGAADTAAIGIALARARLARWSGQIAAGRAPLACAFDAADAVAIAGAASRALRAGGKQAAAFRLEAGAGDLATLEDWGRRWCGADPALARHLADARAALDGLQMRPADGSIDALCEFFGKYHQIVPMGNRLRGLDGLVFGLNNTSLPGFPASPDARGRRSKLAVLEINTGGHAHEVAFGSQYLWQGHGGVQHTTGIDVPGVLKVGVTAGGNVGGEAGFFVGLRCRFLRQLDPQQNGTRAHIDMAGAFWRRTGGVAARMLAADIAAPALWQEMLVDPYFDAAFSVSWQAHPQQMSKVQAYAGAGASVGLGDGASLGPSATLTYELNPSIGLNRSERSGATPRTVVQMGRAARATARAGVSSAAPGASGLGIASLSTTFGASSIMAAARAFERDGRLVSNFVYQDIESETPSSYEARMNRNRAHWAAALGRDNLDAQLERTRRGFQPNQRPAERWRIRADAARRFDALRSALQLRQAALPGCADPGRAAALEAECRGLEQAALRLFTDFCRHWEPVGTWNLELNGATRSPPSLNWWLQLTPERSVLADRELSWLGSSTAQMNRHSRAFEADAPAS